MALSKIKRSDLKFGELLDRGGYSMVYQATWRCSLFKKREVAAKKLWDKVEPNELEIMSKLNHVNIVKLIGVIDDKPEYYLILELCKGGSLRKYLDKRRGKRLPEDQFYDWAMQTARPIEYLKNMGVVHKDIKADNYVIDDNNVLKLTDFGLAKEMKRTESNASERGTYGFMAPELMKERLLSPTYDIFSYGVVLWELFTTLLPYKGILGMAIVWKVCHYNEHPPIPLDCPEPIAELMMQCWQAERTRRPHIQHILSVIADAALTAIKAVTQTKMLEGPWILDTEVGKDGPGNVDCPCGIAVSPANLDVAVADNAGRLEIYSEDGEHRFHLDGTRFRRMKPGTNSFPHSVIISSDGNIYLTTETPFVQMFDMYGWLKGTLVTISPEGKPSDVRLAQTDSTHEEKTKLCGIAINSADELFVGEITQKYVSKHSNNGSHIASFKVDIAPYSLAVTPQGKIIISDWVTKMVHITDHEGQPLNHIKPPAKISQCAYGITFFSDLIFVCNHHSKSICCFSLSGKHLGCLPIAIPSDPSCVTFTPNGKRMMVTYGDSLYSPPAGVAVYRL